MAKKNNIPEVDIIVDEKAGVIREVQPEKLRSKKGHEKRVNASIYLLLILMSIIWLCPFIFLVLQSFRGETGGQVAYILPKQWTLANYAFLFEGARFDLSLLVKDLGAPSTLTSSAPAQFKDENGNFLFTFNSANLYEVVQKNIDAAKAEGADYVIAVSHIGYAEDEIYENLEDIEILIQNTTGFDVVLDAHSHSVIEEKKVTDKGGNEVLLSSTGTKFEYIGKLTLSGDRAKTELIKTADYQSTDPVVDAHIAKIYAEYSTLAERKVASTQVDLITKDATGNRLVRRAETNLGDLCADAFRYALNADIGYVNGGGIRADILKGDIGYTDLLSVLPFNNTLVLAEVSGQTIKDMMEMAMKIWPEENGSFPHLSGITFSVNTSIPSSVVMNEYEEFVGVSGEYRVYDIKVYDKETEKYEPLTLTKTYSIAASNFFLLDYGSGMKMLENSKIIQNDGMLDVEALERYIGEELNGVVGQEYAEAKANITFVDGSGQGGGSEQSPQTADQSYILVWSMVSVISFSFLVVLKRNKVYLTIPSE